MPGAMGRALETAQSLRGQAKRIGNAARTAVLGPMSMLGGQRDDEDESLAAFQGRLERARELLTDPERTEFPGRPDSGGDGHRGVRLQLVARLRGPACRSSGWW